jgi:hypothetical protein
VHPAVTVLVITMSVSSTPLRRTPVMVFDGPNPLVTIIGVLPSYRRHRRLVIFMMQVAMIVMPSMAALGVRVFGGWFSVVH